LLWRGVPQTQIIVRLVCAIGYHSYGQTLFWILGGAEMMPGRAPPGRVWGCSCWPVSRGQGTYAPISGKCHPGREGSKHFPPVISSIQAHEFNKKLDTRLSRWARLGVTGPPSTAISALFESYGLSILSRHLNGKCRDKSLYEYSRPTQVRMVVE